MGTPPLNVPSLADAPGPTMITLVLVDAMQSIKSAAAFT
jgi:hypothetical protein